MSEYCVYTIVKGQNLAKKARSRHKPMFREEKRWVTAGKLWESAREAGAAMPVLFGDASDCSRLLFWGLLIHVQVRDGSTSFTVDRLRRIPGERAPQELVLRSTGKTIAPNFVRPYAICFTPSFVNLADRG